MAGREPHLHKQERQSIREMALKSTEGGPKRLNNAGKSRAEGAQRALTSCTYPCTMWVTVSPPPYSLALIVGTE
ncbi:hypothetical protein SCA6_012831, partial [Theobroma cacao]